VWNEMGEAISGPLVGTQLAYLESGVGEWYEFAAYHPGTEIFEATTFPTIGAARQKYQTTS
jgi:hypothetical protein